MVKTPKPPSRDDVEAGDCSTRWFVRSRTSGKKYLVDVSSYGGNGRCSCRDYEVRMEPVLRNGRKPEEALEAGVLEMREYHLGPWDVCRCYHIMRARDALLDAFVFKLKEAEGRR